MNFYGKMAEQAKQIHTVCVCNSIVYRRFVFFPPKLTTVPKPQDAATSSKVF
jgi:hypothetical protein